MFDIFNQDSFIGVEGSEYFVDESAKEYVDAILVTLKLLGCYAFTTFNTLSRFQGSIITIVFYTGLKRSYLKLYANKDRHVEKIDVKIYNNQEYKDITMKEAYELLTQYF